MRFYFWQRIEAHRLTLSGPNCDFRREIIILSKEQITGDSNHEIGDAWFGALPPHPRIF